MARIWIGTSGWSYRHWHGGVFYPEDLKRGTELEFYAQHFDTVEINSSFYHMPQEKTMRGWAQRVPHGFVYSLKASRFITHIQRLQDVDDALALLLTRVRLLGEKLGVLLFQLPPSFHCDVATLQAFVQKLPDDIRTTFEFRHDSWFCDEAYDVLSGRNVALTIADAPRYPCVEHVTADFVYVRLHGHERLYASEYTVEQLQEWAAKARSWLHEGRDVYVYFDNDAMGYAIGNARQLLGILTKEAQ
jgi:uncharacterized protein YecE (DUF72 family)